MKELRFHEYNEEWVTEFNRIRDYLDHIIQQDVIIHHVGSTSVKGLGAKPIIDIDIEYQGDLNQIIDDLTRHKYSYQGTQGIPGRHVFKRLDDAFYEHHLYAIKTGEQELKKHLDFRDALRSYPSLKKNYEDRKRQLIKQNNKDREHYTNSKTDIINYIMKVSERMKTIVFAGGCFWGVEAYFKLIEGVIDTEVGYIAGNGETSYEEVCRGSGHAEAVLIKYDPEIVQLRRLLDHLFNIIDPTSINKQGNDVGIQYRTGIYNYSEEELQVIHAYIDEKQANYKKPIVLELKTNLEFFKAEEYHQDYLDKNKHGYCHVDLTSHKNV